MRRIRGALPGGSFSGFAFAAVGDRGDRVGTSRVSELRAYLTRKYAPGR